MITLSDEQINALKYLIFMSKDAGPETKKACFAMIDASERFTKAVYFTGNTKDIQYGVHNMVSSNGTTYLDEILKAIGIKFLFSHHHGYFISSGNFNPEYKNGENHTHTIWLSNERYDKFATEVISEDAEKIDLTTDPLYNF